MLHPMCAKPRSRPSRLGIGSPKPTAHHSGSKREMATESAYLVAESWLREAIAMVLAGRQPDVPRRRRQRNRRLAHARHPSLMDQSRRDIGCHHRPPFHGNDVVTVANDVAARHSHHVARIDVRRVGLFA